MTSFSHYPLKLRGYSKSVVEHDKIKILGNLMYFILYLTIVLTMTTFFYQPKTFN